jgi:hypothetical protein
MLVVNRNTVSESSLIIEKGKVSGGPVWQEIYENFLSSS